MRLRAGGQAWSEPRTQRSGVSGDGPLRCVRGSDQVFEYPVSDHIPIPIRPAKKLFQKKTLTAARNRLHCV